jgi:hypothetical protein
MNVLLAKSDIMVIADALYLWQQLAENLVVTLPEVWP